LINVIKGEMSFVGPRPEVKKYIDMLSDQERQLIFSVRPGMTDFASLWNFHEGEILKGSSDPEKTYIEKIRPKKIELQLKYVKEKNFWLDLKLIFKTILRIFK
jgi:lipopolysaccharide/colanic/teichoic acid biosynthesis glycosyltransferase